jgi:signal transduction histidine kinase
MPTMQADFNRIRHTLARRYVTLTSVLLAAFGSVVYVQVCMSHQQLARDQLEQLSRSAAAQLPLLLHEARERTLQGPQCHISDDFSAYVDSHGRQAGLHEQRVVWFSGDGHELNRIGSLNLPDAERLIPSPAERGQARYDRHQEVISLWKPVVLPSSLAGVGAAAQPPLGYVWVTMSTEAHRREMQTLLTGLLVGGGVASLLALFGARWMLRSCMVPLRDQFQRLNRFTADASHELRHPLTAIRALLGTIRQRRPTYLLDEDLHQKLALVDDTTTRMAALIDDLLLLARLDRNADPANDWVSFDFTELVDDICDLYVVQAEACGVRLEGPDGVVQMIEGHPDRLRQVVINLLTNAIDFSPVGGVVRLSLERSGAELLLTVDDQGPGIAPELRKKVFEPFWQLDPARQRRHGSGGLGLAIVRGIVHAHGGRIRVCTAPGGGCRMQIKLPQAVQAAAFAAAAKPPYPPPPTYPDFPPPSLPPRPGEWWPFWRLSWRRHGLDPDANPDGSGPDAFDVGDGDPQQG